METRIAENIRAYRKQQGLTQEKLAEVLGVSVGAVYKWESKSSLPELRLIMEMADAMALDLGKEVADNPRAGDDHRLTKHGPALSPAEVEGVTQTCDILQRNPLCPHASSSPFIRKYCIMPARA